MNFKKHITFILIFVMLLANVKPISGFNNSNNSLGNIKTGDTIYYHVNSYDIPVSELIPSSSFDLTKLQLDLTNSDFGVKIMNTFPGRGLYLMDVFLILGKDVTIPFPDSTTTDITNLFGDTVTLPAGIGVSLGADLPGSNFVTFLSSNTDGGIPIFIEPDNSANYKAYFDGLTDLNGGTLTTTDNTDNLTTVYHISDSSDNVDLSLTWDKTGIYAGLFTNFDLTGSVTGQNNIVNVNFNFNLTKRENKPLPTEIQTKQTQILQFEDIGLRMNKTGDFFDQLFKNANFQFETMKNDFENTYKGNDFLRFKITNVQGMYYQVSIDTFDFNSNSWIFSSQQWYNGFTGLPTNYDPTCAPDCVQILNIQSSLLPPIAPGISPDWRISVAQMATYQSISNSIVQGMLNPFSHNTLLDYGITVNSLSNIAQLRESNNFKFYFDSFQTKLSYDASKVSDLQHIPSNFDGTERATFNTNGHVWSSYTDKGLVAGYGLNLNLTLSVTNFPLNSTYRAAGSLDLGLLVKIRNDMFTTIPDVLNAKPILVIPISTTNTLSSTSLSSSTIGLSGLELAPLIIVFLVMTVAFRKNKK